MNRKLFRYSVTCVLLGIFAFGGNKVQAFKLNNSQIEVVESCQLYIHEGWPWHCCQTFVYTNRGWVPLTDVEWTTGY